MESSQKEQEKEDKQKYLREKILQKNYNAEEFIQFLNQKLNIDSDINKCSFEQLKKTVKQFIAMAKMNEINASQISDFDMSSIQHQNSVAEKFVTFNKIKYIPTIIQQEYSVQYKCIQIEQKHSPSQYLSKKVKCIVSSPERKIVSGILGMATSSFLQFRIKTYGFNWQVGRRYSDFIWLRNSLKKFYPSQIVPPIPNKKAHKRSTRQLQKRMRILTFFLNDLLQYPQFRNSKYVQGFLSLPQQKFEKLQKQADNKKSFQTITTTETLSGNVQINFNQEVYNYNEELPQWIQNCEILYKALTRNSKNLQTHIVNQANTLYDMGDQLADLYEISDKLLKVDKQRTAQNSGVKKIRDIFVTLNNMVIQWGNILKNQIDLIQTNFSTLFKYVRQELMGYRQLISFKTQRQKQYVKLKQDLTRKKQKIFPLHDITKWQIPSKQITFIPKASVYQKKQAFKLMLPKQSWALQEAKNNYCYYLSRVYENSNDCLIRMATKICEGMEEFTIKKKVNNQQVGEMWNQMAYNFSNAFNKKTNKLNLKTVQKIRQEESQQKSGIQSD